MMLKIITRGWEFDIEVGAREPILQIKKKIEVLLNVPVASQTLSIWGCELIDGLDIEDYPLINQGTKIDLAINSMPLAIDENSELRISLKFTATKVNIKVDRTETVGGLKEKIHNIDGTLVNNMRLFFLGTELHDDHHYLTDYRISHCSEILVLHKNVSHMIPGPPPTRLSIVVQTSSSLLNATKIPLILSDSSTVIAMKQMLLSRKILPADDYIFIHKQRIMRDHCSLRWHGVENGDFLYVFKGTVSPGS